MRQKRYFSSESAHGSSTSFGFANDTIVLVFSTRKARDRYVERSRNLSCKAIRASEATSEAANQSMTDNDDGRPRAFTIECWVITDWHGSYPEGCIGHLDIGSTWDDSATRFYR